MPTEISDWHDLDNVRNDLSGEYVLVNDLNSETDGYAGIGDDFEPIGFIEGSDVTSEFGGSFDGGGFEIGDLVIDKQNLDAGDIGVFASTDTGALIENLAVEGSIITNERLVGGLVGHKDGGTIQNCAIHVDVTALGVEFVGGVVGRDVGGTITDSYATGSVEGDERVGGLVGYNGVTITDSYATGSVEGDDQVGGLVGNNDAPITDSYATGSVEGDSRVGGLVGRQRGTIETSYAVASVTGNTDVGGLVGSISDSTEIDSYWDTESTGQSTSGGDATGLTTVEMQGSEAETNMGGFDFADVWDSVVDSDDDTTADGYPILLAVDRENQLNSQGILDPPDPIIVDGVEYDLLVDGVVYDVIID